MLIARVLGVEIAEGVLEPEGREDGRSAVAGTHDVESVDAGLGDEAVEVGVDKGEAGAGTPVAEETGLDIVRGDISLDEGVVLQEDHGWIYAHIVSSRTRQGRTRRTSSDVVRSPTELLDGNEFIIG